MKFIFIAAILCSSLAVAKESYCKSAAGKMLTLSTTNEIFLDEEFTNIRTPLVAKCKELEEKSVPLKELASELHQTCYKLITEKIKGASPLAKYRRACDMGSFATEAYIEGIEHGQIDCGASGGISKKPGGVAR